MKINANNTLIYYVISVMSHVMLILAMILMLDFSSETVMIGNQAEKLVQSYLYKADPAQATTVKSAASNKTIVNKEEKVVARKESNPAVSLKKKSESSLDTLKNMEASKTTSQPPAVSNSSKGAQVDELLAVLHTAIQQKQNYPENALQMERQGRATMKFTLFPDGSIKGLHVAKSSGTESLDLAALAAVRDAAPFSRIDQYLSESKEFSIDVVFELA